MEEKNKEVEIDLLELAHKLWHNKKFIIKITLIGAVVGLVIAFSIPKEYTTTVVFKTSTSQSSLGNMGALASLAGVNLANMQTSEVFSPDLYPNIMSSTPFVRGLLDVRVYNPDSNIDSTLFFYLQEGQNSPWWSKILSAPKLFFKLFKTEKIQTHEITGIADPYFISDEEMGVITVLMSLYNINTEKKTGITTLEMTAQHPVISAFLADTLTSYLQSYIINERTRKAKTDLLNTEKLYIQAKNNYHKTQDELALFLDQNKNIISARYATNQKKIENEATSAYSLYTQMAQQLQMAQIKVQDDTPVFTIIQPAVEPLFPSGPKKKLIFITFVFLSFMGACGYILGVNYLKQLKIQYKRTNQ